MNRLLLEAVKPHLSEDARFALENIDDGCHHDVPDLGEALKKMLFVYSIHFNFDKFIPFAESAILLHRTKHNMDAPDGKNPLRPPEHGEDNIVMALSKRLEAEGFPQATSPSCSNDELFKAFHAAYKNLGDKGDLAYSFLNSDYLLQLMYETAMGYLKTD